MFTSPITAFITLAYTIFITLTLLFITLSLSLSCVPSEHLPTANHTCSHDSHPFFPSGGVVIGSGLLQKHTFPLPAYLIIGLKPQPSVYFVWLPTHKRGLGLPTNPTPDSLCYIPCTYSLNHTKGGNLTSMASLNRRPTPFIVTFCCSATFRFTT